MRISDSGIWSEIGYRSELDTHLISGQISDIGVLIVGSVVASPLTCFQISDEMCFAYLSVLGGIVTEFKTLTLAKNYYSLGSQQSLPAHLKDQFLRSASSISLNLAEGNAKSSKRDRLRIFEIAYGSFREAQTILELGNVKQESLTLIGDQLGAFLFRLIQSLKKDTRSVMDAKL